MTVISPSDSGQVQLINNIVTQLKAIISSQVGTIGTIYEQVPDQAQETNSVIIPPPVIDNVVEDNGKCEITLKFNLIHGFRRTKLSENMDQAQSYQMCHLLVLTSWVNQTLGGYAKEMNLKSSRVIQLKEANTPIVALVTSIEIVTDFNVLTS